MPYSAASFTVSFLRAREEERRVRHLHRTGQDRARRADLEQLAVPLELVAFGSAPHRADHAQRFFHLGVGARGVDAHRRHLHERGPAPSTEVHAPVREDVEHGGPLGGPHRVVVLERHAHHAVADADAACLRRHPREEDLGRAHVGVPLERVVLDGPDPIEAHFLGQDRLFDAVVDDLLLMRASGGGHLGLEDHRELHDTFSTRVVSTMRPCCAGSGC